MSSSVGFCRLGPHSFLAWLVAARGNKVDARVVCSGVAICGGGGRGRGPLD